MDSTLSFGKVHIIEWLSPGDAKTGWELFEELEPMAIMLNLGVVVAFNRVHSRPEFLAHVRAVRDDFSATGQLPLLHIETHGLNVKGNSVGIGSSVDDAVLWPELMEELIPLNQLTGLRLIVVLAACEGFWGLQMLQPPSRAAFLVLLGPNHTIAAGVLSRALIAFYRTAFGERNGNAAFKALNDAVNPEKPSFRMVNAEMAFKMVYQHFLKELCNEEAIARRVAEMNTEMGARHRRERGIDRWAWEVARDRELLHRSLTDHRSHFEAFRRDYFFIDVCPENDRRFPIAFEDCQPVRPGHRQQS